MTEKAIFVRLEAKPETADEVAEFLAGALPVVEGEPDTVAWFAVRFGPTTFAIFDAFPHEEGRQAHLGGGVAAALMANADRLLAEAPNIELADTLADKLPG
ncbi:MAG TPA: antibiotic biosynthesis monooxygenase [Acidimicrobiia bacterium]|jgi:quinol monooxygenase YgiN